MPATSPEVLPPPTRGLVLGSALIGLGATAVVGVLDPHEGGHYPTCPLLAMTGLYCPFCGGLRAVHDLTHLHLGAALDRNPLVVLLLPVVALVWLAWAQRGFTGRRWWGRAPGWTGYAALGLLLVFGVARNLPGWTWLSPA